MNSFYYQLGVNAMHYHFCVEAKNTHKKNTTNIIGLAEEVAKNQLRYGSTLYTSLLFLLGIHIYHPVNDLRAIRSHRCTLLYYIWWPV